MMTYDEVCTYIENIPKFTCKHTHEHTKLLQKLTGVRMDRIRWIHVAGTNGKGSVCACLNRMLCGMGKRTGLFTSPHLLSMRERIRIGHDPVSEDMFVCAFEKVRQAICVVQKSGGEHPTFFETLFLMSLVVFDECQVEYGIMETGMGGRLDATNILENPAVCVISSVGMDHTAYLGDTPEKIAGEKAGIIKRGRPVVYWEQDETKTVIESAAKRLTAPCFPVCEKMLRDIRMEENNIAFSYRLGYDERGAWRVSLAGRHQAYNAALALTAMGVLFGRTAFDDERGRFYFDVCDEYMICWHKALAHVVWPARFSEVSPGFFVDGAHNPPAMEMFAETVLLMEERRKKGGFLLLFGASSDKDRRGMADVLAPLVRHERCRGIILTRFSGMRSADLADTVFDFANEGRIHHTQNVNAALAYIEQRIAEEIADGIRSDEEARMRVYACGSLYLASEIMAHYQR